MIGYIYISSTLSGVAVQDPHLLLPNGGKADFRGKNNTIYNFLSAPRMNLNLKTEDASFLLKNVLVHGSFLTEAHVQTDNLRLSIKSSETSPTLKSHVKGMCNDEQFDILSYSEVKCDDSVLSTKYSTVQLITPQFVIQFKPNRVYNHIKGVAKRLDISIRRVQNVPAHGIIGQSFDRPLKNGKLDHYPSSGEFTTSAMAEGVIDGTAEMYEMPDPFSSRFEYSFFEKELGSDLKNVNDV
jgi:hypothetical protein